MASITISDEILNIVSQAPDDRVVRAMEALHSGSLTVNFRIEGDTIQASVTHIVWKGKRDPVSKDHYYRVLLSPHSVECSCPDYGFRRQICKHIVSTVIALQGEDSEKELTQAIPPMYTQFIGQRLRSLIAFSDKEPGNEKIK